MFFFPCPCLTPIVSDIQRDLNEEKCKKWRKTCGESTLSRRASPAVPGYAPPLSVGTVTCTHKRDFATVTLIPGRCLDRGGGGVSDFTTIEERSKTSVFFRSPLDQKEAIGVVFRSMDPLRRV